MTIEIEMSLSERSAWLHLSTTRLAKIFADEPVNLDEARQQLREVTFQAYELKRYLKSAIAAQEDRVNVE